MRLTLRTLLLIGAVLFFVLAIVVDGSFGTMLAIGLALFAGAFLLDDLGLGTRRIG